MHFSIPDTQECKEDNGSTYIVSEEKIWTMFLYTHLRQILCIKLTYVKQYIFFKVTAGVLSVSHIYKYTSKRG